MLADTVRFDRPLQDVRLIIDGMVSSVTAEEAARNADQERHKNESRIAREEGYRQGRSDGEAAVAETLLTQRRDVLALAEGVLRRLSEQDAALAAQARACLPDLVLNIVRRVLAEVAPDAERTRRLVEQAVGEAPAGGTEALEVSLCPSDLELLEAIGGAELRQRHPRVKLHADPNLSANDCLVRGSFGLIDGRTETQLRSIRRLLADS